MMIKISKKEKVQVFITGGFFVLSGLTIWFLWENSVLSAAILLLLGVIELKHIDSRKLSLIYVLCAFSGAFFESICIYLGIWKYSLPNLFGIPLWLAPGWGNAGIFIVCFYKLLGKVSWLEKK